MLIVSLAVGGGFAVVTELSTATGTSEIVAKPARVDDTAAVVWQQALFRLPSGDVCARSRSKSSTQWAWSLVARQLAMGRAGEDSAARRSEIGCPSR